MKTRDEYIESLRKVNKRVFAFGGSVTEAAERAGLFDRLIPIADRSLPLADAMRMVRALPTLWRDCLGPRLSTEQSAIGSRSDRLYFVSYMWFDVWPSFWNAKHAPEWCDAMWQVFCEMLAMPWREAQVSALHGIGHEGNRLNRHQELQAHMDAFIRQVKNDDELKNYAQAAARGMVQ